MISIDEILCDRLRKLGMQLLNLSRKKLVTDPEIAILQREIDSVQNGLDWTRKKYHDAKAH